MSRDRDRSRSTVAVIGTGLIGTSIGLALLRGRRRAVQIVGWDSRRGALRAASARGGITRMAASMTGALRGASTVVLAAPLDAIVRLAPLVIAAAESGALIVDVGAVKRPILASIRPALRHRPDVSYVSGHPIAGRERPGAASADAQLFAGRAFVLVAPVRSRQARTIAEAERFVRRLGGVPIPMGAQAHDRLAAATSALPQLSSVALALAVDAALGSRQNPFSGPGYRDATRLALSPFDIWKPALAANAANVRSALRGLGRAVARVSRAVERGDDGALRRLFSQAAKARRRVVDE